MSRLTIDVTEQQHQALKALAALEGKTIKQYTLERLFPPDSIADESDPAMHSLRTLLAQRVSEAFRGEVTEESISDIADTALKERQQG